MGPIKNVVKIIPRGQYGDSREESLRYWLARPPAERLEALKELRESTYRRLTGRDFPAMVKVVRPFKPR